MYIFIIVYVFIFLLGICFLPKKTSKRKYQKILEKSNSCFLTSKNSFRVFRGSFDKSSNKTATILTHFTETTQQKRPIIYQIILQNRKFHIFLRKSRFRGIFLLFSKKISRSSNKLVKSSSKIAFFVFVIAIFHFLEDRFYVFDVFYFSHFPKKRVKSLHWS